MDEISSSTVERAFPSRPFVAMMAGALTLNVLVSGAALTARGHDVSNSSTFTTEVTQSNQVDSSHDFNNGSTFSDTLTVDS